MTLLLILWLSLPQATACSPAPGFKAPTIQENYANAQTVVFGYIEKKDPATEGYSYQIQVEKAWKGTYLKSLRVTSGLANTCDGFAQTAEVGAGCVLLLGNNNKIFSGIEFGQASICIPKDSERLKSLVSEYSGKFTGADPKSDCESRGGRWEGTQVGKGRLTGCNMPTVDGGKSCKSGDDCQSVCLREGRCHGWMQYKGCGSFHGHKGVLCVD